MRPQYALLYWEEIRESGVVNLKKVPKMCRKVGSTFPLQFMDSRGITKKASKAKLLAISSNDEDLKAVYVNDSGELSGPLYYRNKIMNQGCKPKVKKEKEKSLKQLREENKENFFKQITPTQSIAHMFNVNRIQKENESVASPSPSTYKIDYTEILPSASAPSSSYINYDLPSCSYGARGAIRQTTLADSDKSSDTETSESLLVPINEPHSTPSRQLQDLQNMMPYSITFENIKFLEALLNSAKKCYEENSRVNNSTVTLEIADQYKIGQPDNVEIAPQCGFYLPKTKKTYIELYARDDWRKLVRETLMEVYGAGIANYSAKGKGKKNSRPAIDMRLYRGLFDWANIVSPKIVSEKEYVALINKIASNKRKYQKKGEE